VFAAFTVDADEWRRGFDEVRNRIARWQHTPTNVGCRSAGVRLVRQQPECVGGVPTVGRPTADSWARNLRR
jgi:hypothetical protein